ncbi:uncharacterized protein LOC121729025 [Aricia agestis]|uniref:uncharacterized protein LOC121729025 n=1 Tax=Aricia agestis TaxID=91739 RepID=UPI001C205230|nr:uncharacterized protein LOC121729025 [Aricia agestis]
MLCSARCQCFLCRELQSCRAADSRKPPGKHGMADNFILRKAEAWEPMKFIRGAARMSVRHWQSREPLAPPKPRASPHKSTSCEQLYTPAVEDAGPFAMRRAPSTDRVKYVEHKPLFKMLGNSRSKKPSSGDSAEPNPRRSVLNFKKHESAQSKNVHEKYVPLQAAPAERGGDARPRPDDCCRPPVYTSVDKHARDTPDRKMGTRPPCYDELAERLERNKKTAAPGELANKITQNNNKVVIYFGDSIIRKHNEQKKEEDKKEKQADRSPKEEAIYVNQPLDESDAGTNREVDKGGTQLVSEVEVPEAIYAEIAPEEAKEPEAPPINDATYKKDVHETMGADGFVVVQFEGNYERARQLVELVHSGGKLDQNEATVLDEDEHCDWSFIQDWRKRPSSGCRPEEWCGGAGGVGGGGARALRVRVASAAPAHARRLSPPPPAHRATTPPPLPPNDAATKP